MWTFRRQRSIRWMGVVPGIALAVMATAPAQANPLMFVVNVKPASMLAAMASASSQCTFLTYDKNGNRLSQTVTPITNTTTTWGMATYGCFTWQQ